MSVCFVVLVIQHAIRVLHIVICDLSGPKLFLYIHKGRNFRKKTY
jgi:hypothetical protein